jgi:hypothetical protein
LRRITTTGLVLGGVGIVVVALGLLWATGSFSVPNPRPVLTKIAQTPSPGLYVPSPSPTATPPGPGEALAPSAMPPTQQPAPVVNLPQLPEVTPPSGGQVYSLIPPAEAVGWVREGDEKPNHFGDYNIYAGVFEGQRQLGAVQFDLSQIPPGAPVVYADLALIGLSGEWLGDAATWTVRLLEPWMDENWSQKSFADLGRADGVSLELAPNLAVSDLGAGQANIFVLEPQALQALEARVFAGAISFRIDGPASGANNLFSWDSGYGAGSRGWAPVLRVVTGLVPEEPPAPPTPRYVIVTSTPTPANIVTMAAIAVSATAQATTTGTPTPLPPHWVTPFVVVSTATPANLATTQWHAAVATAEISLYGTPTPLPPNAWTATPSVVFEASASGFVVVTSTPTPENVLTAAAIAARQTVWATTTGTAIATPEFIVTATPLYIVVTNTPTPANWATAVYLRALATARVILTGTPTPTPANLVTATYTPRPTQTPVLIWLDQVTTTPTPRVTPTPTPTPTPPLPAVLRGKIAFFSDRGGESAVYILDPDTGRLGLLTDRWPYDLASAQDRYSPDGQYAAVVRGNDVGVQIYVTQLSTGTSWAITFGAALDYDPVWSPQGDLIAYVSQEMGPAGGADEIFVVNPQGSGKRRLTFNTWEWDKHPSFSPDGSQIVFWSNQTTGRKQIWIMDSDGTDRRIFLQSPYNDWDPVWIK